MAAMLHTHSFDGYLALDEKECRDLGRSLAKAYQTASPFPHVVIDEFLDPTLLRRVLNDFPPRDSKEFFDRDQERLKFQFQPQDVPSGLIRNLFAELNSRAFIGFLE